MLGPDHPAMNQSRPRGKAATAGVAMWSARHRWAVIGAWLLATVGLFVVSRVAGSFRERTKPPGEAYTSKEPPGPYMP